MTNPISLDQNQAAFSSGRIRRMMIVETANVREKAFPAYRAAVSVKAFKPSVSASICFVAGFLGNEYPTNDSRVTA